MSDWYDSLEDESDEKYSSSDSLNENKSDAFGFPSRVSESKPKDNNSDPFYLNRKVIEENSNLILNYHQNSKEEELQKKNFLPKIETTAKGWSDTSNLIIVDNQLLKEQGLQINKDGSFTKSPRSLADELPFITREYRNLQFQKKKTYKMTKKAPPRVPIQKKNIFSFSKNSNERVSANKISNTRQSEGCGKNFPGRGSLSPRFNKQLKLDKQILGNDNLTDSMKEKLLQNSRDNCQKRLQISGGLKKTKRVMNLLETSSQKKFSSQQLESPEKSSFEGEQNSNCNERFISCQKKNRFSGPVIGGKYSDNVLRGFKTNLSYAERRQMENGFKPLHLRPEGKKVFSECNRSNFGDSVAESLSDISTAIICNECQQEEEEDEESFYRRLMEKDSMQKLIQRSSRSEDPNEFSSLKHSPEAGFSRDRKEVKIINYRIKPVSKSMSIDLSSGVDGTIRTKKKNLHYCSADSSPNMSKFELALKAKTYGYLVNARNIFKMKTQSEGKLNSRERIENSKSFEKNQILGKKSLNRDKWSKNCTSKATLSEVQEKFPRAFEKMSSNSKTPCKMKNSKLPKDSSSGISLPRVTTGVENRDMKTQNEILSRMRMFEHPKCVSSTFK